MVTMADANDTRNEDWLRTRSWDLPTDLDGFLALNGNDVERVKHFLTLPAAEAMPADLKRDVDAWIAQQ